MNATPNSRPQSVTIAVLLMLLVMIVGIISSYFQMSHDQQLQSMSEQLPAMQSIMYVIMAVIFVLELFFLFKVFQGRNWARITLLVFFIIGVLASIPGYLGLGHMPTPASAKLVGGISQLVELVAFILLFTGQGSAWFKKRTG